MAKQKNNTQSSLPQSILNDPFFEYQVERSMAQDKDMQNQACRDYLANTSPAEWSFEGWLHYWRLHEPGPAFPGMPEEIMYIHEARFEELRRAAAFAQGIEEPGAPARPARKKAQALTEEERLARIMEIRERIRQMPEYLEAVEKGWLKGFQWQRVTYGPYLHQWLIESGIACKRGSITRWGVIDGVFEDKQGNPITVNSLSSMQSQISF